VERGLEFGRFPQATSFAISGQRRQGPCCEAGQRSFLTVFLGSDWEDRLPVRVTGITN
jgi:hypothetical protein